MGKYPAAVLLKKSARPETMDVGFFSVATWWRKVLNASHTLIPMRMACVAAVIHQGCSHIVTVSGGGRSLSSIVHEERFDQGNRKLVWSGGDTLSFDDSVDRICAAYPKLSVFAFRSHILAGLSRGRAAGRSFY